jgi:hypothetical protein
MSVVTPLPVEAEGREIVYQIRWLKGRLRPIEIFSYCEQLVRAISKLSCIDHKICLWVKLVSGFLSINKQSN